MNLIIKNIEELKKQFGYQNIKRLKKEFCYVTSSYDDVFLIRYEENLIFLDILREILSFHVLEHSDFFSAKPEITLECILYSEYYWNFLLLKRAETLSLMIGDLEEWQFYLIKQIDLHAKIDCDLLEKIENNQI